MGAPPPGDAERDAFVRRMFSRMAHKYDLYARLLTLGRDGAWRRTAVDALQLRPGDRVVDLGAGTGALSHALARRAGAGRVVAVDASRGMVATGRRRAGRRGGGVAFVAGTALQLPFRDGSFDAAASAFVLRNVSSPRRLFAEAHRVLRPGGRLACVDIVDPPGTPLGRAYAAHFHRLIPWLGRALATAPAPHRYLSESLRAGPRPEASARLLEEAGFRDVAWRPLTQGVAALHTATRPP